MPNKYACKIQHIRQTATVFSGSTTCRRLLELICCGYAGTAPSAPRKHSLKATHAQSTAKRAGAQKPQKAQKQRPCSGSMKQLESFFGAPARSKK